MSRTCKDVPCSLSPSSSLRFHSPSLWEAASFIKWLNFVALLSFLIICLLSQPSWELIEGKTWKLELFQVIFFWAPGHPGVSSPPCNLHTFLTSLQPSQHQSHTSLTPRSSMWQPVTNGNMWLPNPIIIMTFDALDSETKCSAFVDTCQENYKR